MKTRTCCIAVALTLAMIAAIGSAQAATTDPPPNQIEFNGERNTQATPDLFEFRASTFQWLFRVASKFTKPLSTSFWMPVPSETIEPEPTSPVTMFGKGSDGDGRITKIVDDLNPF